MVNFPHEEDDVLGFLLSEGDRGGLAELGREQQCLTNSRLRNVSVHLLAVTAEISTQREI